jgi:transposase
LVCAVLRATDLHRERQRDFGYNGSYPTFGRQMRELRPAMVIEAEVRFETVAGVQTKVRLLRETLLTAILDRAHTGLDMVAASK